MGNKICKDEIEKVKAISTLEYCSDNFRIYSY